MMPSQPVMQSRPSYTTAPSSTSVSPTVTSPKPTSGSTFDDLWTTSLTSAGGQAKATTGAGAGKTIKDLEKEKAMDKLWGPTPTARPAQAAGQSQPTSPAKPSGGFDDLLI